MWACYCANDVEGVVYIGHPVAHGLVERIFEGFAAAFHGHYCGTQQLHAVHIGALAFDVLAAHVHHTFQAIAGADGGGGHAVLARTRLGNDAGFAHAPRQHGLPDGVVDFVRARVVKVFAFEKNLCAALFAAHARRMVNGRGAAHKMGQFVFEFGQKFGVVLVAGVGLTQLLNGVGEGFTDEAAPVNAKMARGIGLLVVKHGFHFQV